MSLPIRSLQDPASSGVYRVNRGDIVADAVRGSRLNLGQVALRGAIGKVAMMECIAKALAFPDWFGANWDALEDCLTDLSWREADGHVLIFENFEPSEDLGVLIDVLGDSAQFWAARQVPFFALFVDPDRTLGLADLFGEP